MICPSACPFDHGEMIAFFTASMFFSTPPVKSDKAVRSSLQRLIKHSSCRRADHGPEVPTLTRCDRFPVCPSMATARPLIIAAAGEDRKRQRLAIPLLPPVSGAPLLPPSLDRRACRRQVRSAQERPSCRIPHSIRRVRSRRRPLYRSFKHHILDRPHPTGVRTQRLSRDWGRSVQSRRRLISSLLRIVEKVLKAAEQLHAIKISGIETGSGGNCRQARRNAFGQTNECHRPRLESAR